MKVWDDEEDSKELRPDSVTVTVTSSDDDADDQELELNEENSWQAELTDQDRWQYSDDGQAAEITWTVSEEQVEDYEEPVIEREPEEGFTDGTVTWTVTNSLTPNRQTVSGRKLWQKPESAPLPEKLTVTLKVQLEGETIENGVLTTDATADSDWTYTFENVPIHDSEGRAYTYDITEALPITVAGGSYVPVESVKNETNGVDFTNRWLETVTIDLVKVWNDEDDAAGLRPDSVTLTVTASVDGTEIGSNTAELSEDTDWKAQLTGMPRWQYNDDGEPVEITYTVTEEQVSNYEKPVTEREPEEGYNDAAVTYTVTNTLKPTKVTVSGKKLWQKPESAPLPNSVTVVLEVLLDGETIENGTFTAKATGDNDWTYTFENVPTRDEEGHEYTFQFSEQAIMVEGGTYALVEQWDNDTRGRDLVNRWQEQLSLILVKQWDDNDNSEQLRPETVTMQVKGTVDGKEVSSKTVTLAADTEWETIVPGLARWYYTEDGEPVEITYDVTEDDVPEYQMKGVVREPETGYDDQMATYTVTNALAPIPYPTVSGKKIWQKPEEAPYPDSVAVTAEVLLDGKVVPGQTRTVYMTAENGWTYSFTDLPYKDRVTGKIYTYRLSENSPVKVGNGFYDKVEERENETGGIDFVNQWKEGILITLNKVWVDEDNLYGTRPEKIVFHVVTKVNGEMIEEEDVPLMATADWNSVSVAKNRWLYTDGSDTPSEYTYTVTEQPVEGYPLSSLTREPE